jgi:glycerol kinase
MLPTIRPNRSGFGTARVGEQAVPVTVITGDQAAAIYALGEPEPGMAFVNIGTGAFIQVATGETPVQDDALLSSVVWQDEGGLRYVLEGTVNGAASAIDAVSRELDVHAAPDSPELARALGDIERAPLYLNGISGLGSPDWVPDFTSRFVGSGNALACLAAAYESIAFLVQRNLDALSQRVPVTAVKVSGGLGRLDWLVQRIADLSGLPVVRPADTEATLSGLACLASGGAIVANPAATGFRPQPNSGARQRYRDWTRALEDALEL